MKLSIIIINWNTEKLLRDCLASVYKNSPDYLFETIVVDNASADGSPEMVKRLFPQVFLIENKKNLGFAAANNIGIGASSGEYVLLLNSDTLVHGDVLASSTQYLDKTPVAGALGCRVLNADKTLQHSTSQFPSFLNLFLQTSGLDRIKTIPFLQRYRMQYWKRERAQAVETISGCYLMARRATFKDIGLLDESFFFFGEETDWCKRLRDTGQEIHFAPVGSVTHFGGGSSASLNYRRDLMLTQATVRLHLKHNGLLHAILVFLLLLIFNASRTLYWTIFCTVKENSAAFSRMQHFWGVCSHFLKAWPDKRGASL